MTRKPKGRLKPELYAEIREYSRNHTIQETADKYDLSASTISWIKRYDNFREMKQARAEDARNYNRKVNNIPPENYKIGDVAPGEPKPIGSPFEPGAEPTTVLPVNLKKAPEQDGEVETKPSLRYREKTAYEWWQEYDKQRNAYDKAIEEFATVADEKKDLEEQVRLLKEQLEKATDTDWKRQYDLVCQDRQKIWNELQGVKKLTGVSGDPSKMITVTVGETKVEIPINIKP